MWKIPHGTFFEIFLKIIRKKDIFFIYRMAIIFSTRTLYDQSPPVSNKEYSEWGSDCLKVSSSAHKTGGPGSSSAHC